MELDLDDADDQDEHQVDNWDDEHEPSRDKCESDWRHLGIWATDIFSALHNFVLQGKKRRANTINGSLLQAASLFQKAKGEVAKAAV